MSFGRRPTDWTKAPDSADMSPPAKKARTADSTPAFELEGEAYDAVVRIINTPTEPPPPTEVLHMIQGVKGILALFPVQYGVPLLDGISLTGTSSMLTGRVGRVSDHDLAQMSYSELILGVTTICRQMSKNLRSLGLNIGVPSDEECSAVCEIFMATIQTAVSSGLSHGNMHQRYLRGSMDLVLFGDRKGSTAPTQAREQVVTGLRRAMQLLCGYCALAVGCADAIDDQSTRPSFDAQVWAEPLRLKGLNCGRDNASLTLTDLRQRFSTFLSMQNSVNGMLACIVSLQYSAVAASVSFMGAVARIPLNHPFDPFYTDDGGLRYFINPRDGSTRVFRTKPADTETVMKPVFDQLKTVVWVYPKNHPRYAGKPRLLTGDAVLESF